MVNFYASGFFVAIALACLTYHKFGKGMWARLDALLFAILATGVASILVVTGLLDHLEIVQ